MKRSHINWIRGVLVVGLGLPALWCAFPGLTMLGYWIGTSLFGWHMHQGWEAPPGRIDSWLLGVWTIVLPMMIPKLGAWSQNWYWTHQLEKKVQIIFSKKKANTTKQVRVSSPEMMQAEEEVEQLLASNDYQRQGRTHVDS